MPPDLQAKGVTVTPPPPPPKTGPHTKSPVVSLRELYKTKEKQ